MLLASRVADATQAFDGVAGAVLARADVAAVVLIVLAVATAARSSVERITTGAAPVSWRAHLTRWLLPLYVVWIPVVVIDLVALDPPRSGRSLVSTLLLFRDLRGAPMLGTGVGPVVTVVAMAVVLLPLLERALVGRAGRLPIVAVGTIAVGLAVRTVLVVGGWTAPFGALSWLPAHLDAVGAGLAIAVLRVAGRITARLAAIAVGAAVVAFGVGAAVLPRTVLVTGGADVWVRGLLYVIVAAGVVVAVGAGPSRRTTACVATAAPGLVLAGELAFVVIARQHADGVVDGPLGLRLTAAAVPTWIWSLAIAVGIGVLLTTVLLVPLRRAMGGRWPSQWYPLALGAVVSVGLMVRVTTWLTVAPTKTDGGDPLFYHVTANMLAAGRGFLEPLNWMKSQAQIPSALHGPLYPVVLSFSSRLGGTTYVDHKFMSILIGTATVLVTALVAGRLAGRGAAIVAGSLAAVYPNLWLVDSLLFPEGLAALLTTLCFLVAYRWRDRPTWVGAAMLGALIGLAGLTCGESLLLGVLLAVPWMLGQRALRLATRWRHLAVSGVACLVVLAPWTIRNLQTYEVFVPISTNSNELIMYANCSDTYSGRFLGFWSFACQERYRAEHGDPPGDEAQKAAFWRDVGIDYARGPHRRGPEGRGDPRAAPVGAVPSVADGRLRDDRGP